MAQKSAWLCSVPENSIDCGLIALRSALLMSVTTRRSGCVARPATSSLTLRQVGNLHDSAFTQTASARGAAL